jgi:hypothetical protein
MNQCVAGYVIVKLTEVRQKGIVIPSNFSMIIKTEKVRIRKKKDDF